MSQEQVDDGCMSVCRSKVQWRLERVIEAVDSGAMIYQQLGDFDFSMQGSKVEKAMRDRVGRFRNVHASLDEVLERCNLPMDCGPGQAGAARVFGVADVKASVDEGIEEPIQLSHRVHVSLRRLLCDDEEYLIWERE